MKPYKLIELNNVNDEDSLYKYIRQNCNNPELLIKKIAEILQKKYEEGYKDGDCDEWN